MYLKNNNFHHCQRSSNRPLFLKVNYLFVSVNPPSIIIHMVPTFTDLGLKKTTFVMFLHDSVSQLLCCNVCKNKDRSSTFISANSCKIQFICSIVKSELHTASKLKKTRHCELQHCREKPSLTPGGWWWNCRAP